MADLMNKVEASKTPFVSPHKGDILTGIITKLTSGEILVDINAKTEAVVLEKDKRLLKKLLATLKIGDKVKAQVLNPESDFGNPVVSLRRFIDDISWENLSLLQKAHSPVDVVVDSGTKGGFLVTTLDGVSGFLPNSHISSLTNPQGFIGKKIKVILLELNRGLRKIIFSQKQVLGISDFQKLIRNIKTGQKINATVSNITSFGIFLSIDLKDAEVEGFIHISEVSWENILDLSSMFKLGDKVTGIVIGFDNESRRVNLSIKRLTANPHQKKLDAYTIDRKLKAKVSKAISTGVLLDLPDNVTGIIKKDKIPPGTLYKEGMEIDVMVTGTDKRRQRVELVPILKEKPIGYR